MSEDQRLRLRRKLALAIEVVASYVRARWLLRRHPLPFVLDELRRTSPGDHAHAPVASDERLARAVQRTLGPLPADTRCLMQSLVLTRLLARRGRQAKLVIGVSPAGMFTAHAWVEREGVPLLPADDKEFSRLVEL
jgi:hypothetical protein